MTPLLILYFLATAVSAGTECIDRPPNFSITPDHISLCGQVTKTAKFDCQIHSNVDAFLIEIGKNSVRGQWAIARILPDHHYNFSIIDSSYRGRLTQQYQGHGRLTIILDKPTKDDLGTYYCKVAYLEDVLRYGEVWHDVKANDLTGQVPTCNQTDVDDVVRSHASVMNPAGGTCPGGKTGRPETLVLEFCQGRDIGQWKQGQKVMDMCCQIPPYTPVATFIFGVHVVGEQGLAGVFLQCIPNGFSMALQLCGYGTRVVNLTRGGGKGAMEDPEHYYVSQFTTMPIVG